MEPRFEGELQALREQVDSLERGLLRTANLPAGSRPATAKTALRTLVDESGDSRRARPP